MLFINYEFGLYNTCTLTSPTNYREAKMDEQDHKYIRQQIYLQRLLGKLTLPLSTKYVVFGFVVKPYTTNANRHREANYRRNKIYSVNKILTTSNGFI